MKCLLLLSLVSMSNACCCCAPAYTTCCMAFSPPTIIGYQRIPIYARVPRREMVPVEPTYELEEVQPAPAVRSQQIIVEESSAQMEAPSVIIQRAPAVESVQPSVILQRAPAQVVESQPLVVQSASGAALPTIITASPQMSAQPSWASSSGTAPAPSISIQMTQPAGYPTAPNQAMMAASQSLLTPSLSAPIQLPPQAPPMPSYSMPQQLNSIQPMPMTIAQQPQMMPSYQPSMASSGGYLSSAPNAKKLLI